MVDHTQEKQASQLWNLAYTMLTRIYSEVLLRKSKKRQTNARHGRVICAQLKGLDGVIMSARIEGVYCDAIRYLGHATHLINDRVRNPVGSSEMTSHNNAMVEMTI